MSTKYLTQKINIPLDCVDPMFKICHSVGLKPSQIKSVTLNSQSLDARRGREMHFVCSYVIETDAFDVKNCTPYVEPYDALSPVKNKVEGKSCIIVGAGPAGLFLARYLTTRGVKVIVIERGSNLPKRREDVRSYFSGGDFNAESNVQYGLGGAGAFSDGKLTCGNSSPLIHTVFKEFVRCGAPKDIMTTNMPHVGTDKLVAVVSKMRDKIVGGGGEFRFDTLVTDLIVKDGKVVGVKTINKVSTFKLYADCVCLCVGNSARDVYKMLKRRGVNLQFKPFAVGLRVEHPRKQINSIQYGMHATHRDLPSASYKMAYNGRSGHSCYTFCMCPGGSIIAANSEPKSVVTNGMSNYARDDDNSNSALVVNVGLEDMARWGYDVADCLCGVRFQQDLERAAYKLGGGNFRAPAQNVADFVQNVASTSIDLRCSYPRGVMPCNLRTLFPAEINDTIADGLQYFEQRMEGFSTSGTLVGVETRTSAPVRIVRGEDFQAGIRGLYPVGEGAGYAGGIVSSGVDALRVGEAIIKSFS